MAYKYWTTEEDDKLKTLVGQTSFKQMAENYFTDRSGPSISHRSNVLGLKSEYLNHKYTVNKNYWNKLNLNKCYYAGYIASDGNLKKDCYAVSFHSHPKDVSILENFIKETEYTGKVQFKTQKKYKTNEIQHTCSLRIQSGIKSWYDDLFKYFNITPQKTFTLEPPNIQDKYLQYAYLIGLLDGDGWICTFTKGTRTTIGFVCASKILVEWVKTIFSSIIDVSNLQVRTSENGNYYTFAVGNKKSLVIIDYLRQFTVPKLTRKWDKPEVLERIDKYKSEHPELFKTLK